MTVHVAIVGAGPAGLYAADALSRKAADARIDVVERLPTPFGLVRGGVAPDHQGTKAIARQFERTLGRDGIRFVGNVEVGRDVAIDDLRAMYDAVVVAVGAGTDRRLGIPGEDLPGVYGSGAFVGWYNGHPDFRDLAPGLDRPEVVVVGNGNVAVDVVRVLAKGEAEMTASDLCAHAARAIRAAPIERLTMAGRRGPAEAAFTPAELAELGRLERCRVVVDADAIPAGAGGTPETEKNVEILRGFAEGGETKPMTLDLVFHAAPVAILGDGRAEAVRFERTRLDGGRAVGTGETFEVAAGLVVTAIGYRTPPLAGVPMDEGRGTTANEDGRIAPGLYAVGWAKRGPSGTIPTNRFDSISVAEHVVADLADAPGDRPGGAALDAHLAGRGVRIVGFADWKRIEAAEAARAEGRHPREKFTRVDEMLAVLDGA